MNNYSNSDVIVLNQDDMELFLDDFKRDIHDLTETVDRLYFEWSQMFAGISGETAYAARYEAGSLLARMRSMIEVLERARAILVGHLEDTRDIELDLASKLSR